MPQDFLEKYWACSSPELSLIRPVVLKARHLIQMNEYDSECHICYEQLNKDAVQFRCCGALFHRKCIKSHAETLCENWDVDELQFCCLHCRRMLNAHPEDILLHIGDTYQIAKIRVSVHPLIEQCIDQLSRVNLKARLAYLEFLDRFSGTGRPHSGNLRYTMCANTAIRKCKDDGEKEVMERLIEERAEYQAPLLEYWLEWLKYPTDLRFWHEWHNVPTRYGNGPDRFEPEIPDRMLIVQPEATAEPKVSDIEEICETPMGQNSAATALANNHDHPTLLARAASGALALLDPTAEVEHPVPTPRSKPNPFAHFDSRIQQVIAQLRARAEQQPNQTRGTFPMIFVADNVQS
ncbi:hypothetical protein PMZ80_001387 [Knufia obscura]|uniref:RING-type domain-containing protein n=1 Tax=Knufia obscura TaxID=1635080 RepID=A0ABR0S457_9EURO|nr:hypothetical protein PMZ80_001387 [Knufia obscura]